MPYIRRKSPHTLYTVDWRRFLLYKAAATKLHSLHGGVLSAKDFCEWLEETAPAKLKNTMVRWAQDDFIAAIDLGATATTLRSNRLTRASLLSDPR